VLGERALATPQSWGEDAVTIWLTVLFVVPVALSLPAIGRAIQLAGSKSVFHVHDAANDE
jgi:hypothetical protein